MHSFLLYCRLVGIQIRSQMQYRVSFVTDIITTLMITFFEFGALVLVMQRLDSLGGWTVFEVGVLVGSVEVSFGVMDMVFSGFDPAYFGRFVRKGTFDQLLLRPINITIQVLGSDFATRRLGKIGLGIVILGVALTQVGIQWTAVKLFLVPVMLLSMFAFFSSLFVIGAAITFWTIDSIEAMNVMTYGSNYAMSHPMHIYQDWLRRFFTFIVPTIFLNYYPVLYILDKPDPLNMPAFAPFLSPLVGFIFLYLAFSFWNYGIQQYQSTGT